MMEFSNAGESVYHRFEAFFLRTPGGLLRYCSGPAADCVRSNWEAVASAVLSPDGGGGASDKPVSVVVHRPDEDARPFLVREKAQPSTGRVAGIVVRGDAGADAEPFDAFFLDLLLDRADLAIAPRPAAPASPPPDVDGVTEQLVTLFENTIQYRVERDRWAAAGRAYFRERVRHFTAQGLPVEFCLPAFPCKSSNPRKVAGTRPDRGEEIGLTRLHEFVEAVEAVYAPGGKLWIVSDGHVFSDCIGVGDDHVDVYTRQLKEMNAAIVRRRGGAHRIGFMSLPDIFGLGRRSSSDDDDALTSLAERLHIPPVEHNIDTLVTAEAETCRRILMAGCAPRRASVRATIDARDPSLLALYRGFSRFMLEDLEMCPATMGLSRSKLRKLSSKVAFEMIMRNQAYSNLVELVLPNHVRLSIHAHVNSGPKFGIQLFDPRSARAVRALDPAGQVMSSDDLLHIPTPWHNCVVEVEVDGRPVLLVTKSQVVRDGIDSGLFVGSFRDGPEAGHFGGYFRIQHAGKRSQESEPALAEWPAAEKSAAEKSAAEKSVAEKSVAEKSTAEKYAVATKEAVAAVASRRSNAEPINSYRPFSHAAVADYRDHPTSSHSRHNAYEKEYLPHDRHLYRYQPLESSRLRFGGRQLARRLWVAAGVVGCWLLVVLLLRTTASPRAEEDA